MLAFWILIGVLLLGWVFVNLPRRRCDGELLAKIHPYRRMLGFVMPTRNESPVYFDDYILADKLLDFIARTREKFHCDITHCVVAACSSGFRHIESMNRFVAGQRLYQRNHIAITFSMKRKRMDARAKVSAVKISIEDDWSFQDICAKINSYIRVERSDKQTYTDKELGMFFKLPRFAVRWAMKAANWADYHNLLPESFIKNDGFFTSIFIANLGSVGMRAGYHHLYNYGTCPLFLMLGRIEERAWVVDGQVVPRKILHVRFSYDERIDDGLTAKEGIDWIRTVLEAPEEYFGRVEEFTKVEGTEVPGARELALDDGI